MRSANIRQGHGARGRAARSCLPACSIPQLHALRLWERGKRGKSHTLGCFLPQGCISLGTAAPLCRELERAEREEREKEREARKRQERVNRWAGSSKPLYYMNSDSGRCVRLHRGLCG